MTRKDIALPGLALAGGLLCFGLRRWQLASAFHPETGLFTHGAPATWALLALTAALLLALFLLVRGERVGPDDFLPAFSCARPICSRTERRGERSASRKAASAVRILSSLTATSS